MSPVVHPKDWSLIRVPLCKMHNRYSVYVSDDLVRHYTDETLPDVLRVKMAMILASTQPQLIPEERMSKIDRKSTRLNSSHVSESRMPSSA